MSLTCVSLGDPPLPGKSSCTPRLHCVRPFALWLLLHVWRPGERSCHRCLPLLPWGACPSCPGWDLRGLGFFPSFLVILISFSIAAFLPTFSLCCPPCSPSFSQASWWLVCSLCPLPGDMRAKEQLTDAPVSPPVLGSDTSRRSFLTWGSSWLVHSGSQPPLFLSHFIRLLP